MEDRPGWVLPVAIGGFAWFALFQVLGRAGDGNVLLGLSYFGTVAGAVAAGWSAHLRLKAQDQARRTQSDEPRKDTAT